MKKTFLLLAILVSGVSAYAAEDIAVVDLTRVVENSSQVRQLKQEHAKKMSELDKIIVNARGEIANEKDPAKVLLIEDKYMKEFNSKKDALEKDYNSRLLNVEKTIQNEVLKKAQSDKYSYVFAKSVVLYGGKDITEEILNKVK